jgi:dTMP kinase
VAFSVESANGRRGRLITFEGGEGAGKSTQVARLARSLRRIGLEVLISREPGGAPAAERLRGLLLAQHDPPFLPLTEAILHAAARFEHVTHTVRPALAAGRWLICDRFFDSTRAYQGFGMGVDANAIEALRRLTVGDLVPDLTLILDLPVEEGLRRAATRHPLADRYQALALPFHERVRDGFLSIAAAEPERCRVIDATGSEAEVAARIEAAVRERFADEVSRLWPLS